MASAYQHRARGLQQSQQQFRRRCRRHRSQPDFGRDGDDRGRGGLPGGRGRSLDSGSASWAADCSADSSATISVAASRAIETSCTYARGTGLITCGPTTRNGLTVTRVVQFQTAAGTVAVEVRHDDELRHDEDHGERNDDATRQQLRARSTLSSNQTVTGLAKGSTRAHGEQHVGGHGERRPARRRKAHSRRSASRATR